MPRVYVPDKQESVQNQPAHLSQSSFSPRGPQRYRQCPPSPSTGANTSAQGKTPGSYIQKQQLYQPERDRPCNEHLPDPIQLSLVRNHHRGAGIAVPGIFHTEKDYKIFILVHISLLFGLCLCHTNSFNSLQDILGCVMSTVFHPCHVTYSVSHLTLHTIHMATHVILSTRFVIRNVILFISGVTSTLQEHYWFKHLPNSVWKYLTNSFPGFCIIKLVGSKDSTASA